MALFSSPPHVLKYPVMPDVEDKDLGQDLAGRRSHNGNVPSLTTPVRRPSVSPLAAAADWKIVR